MAARKHPYAVTAVEPGAAAMHAAPEALQRTVDRLLTTSVRRADQVPEPVTLLRHVNLQQMAALEVSGAPMRLTNALSHPDAVFVFVLVHGACRLKTERGGVDLHSGQFTVMRGDLSVYAVHHEPFLIRGTRIPAAQLERELPNWQRAELMPVAVAEHGNLLVCLQEQLLTSGPSLGSRSADAYAQMLACVLADALRGVLPLAAVDEPQTQAEHHRRRIRAHVREHLGDPWLDAGSVAAAVGLSVAHLHRLFAAEPQSLFAWVLDERLEACRAALAEPADKRSVKEIAFAWGFKDQAHFSRGFRRRFGLSPRQWRARPVPDGDAAVPLKPPE